MSSSASQEDGTNGDPPINNPLGGGVTKEQDTSSEIGRPPLERRHRKKRRASVLGPLLFLIFINDLENELTCNHLFFADDVKVIAPISQQHEMRSSTEQALNWSRRWDLPLTASKSHHLSIGGHPFYVLVMDVHAMG